MNTLMNGPMIELLLVIWIMSYAALNLWKLAQQAKLVGIQAEMRDRYAFNANTQLNHDALNRMTDQMNVRLNKLSEKTIKVWETELMQKETELALKEASLGNKNLGSEQGPHNTGLSSL